MNITFMKRRRTKKKISKQKEKPVDDFVILILALLVVAAIFLIISSAGDQIANIGASAGSMVDYNSVENVSEPLTTFRVIYTTE